MCYKKKCHAETFDRPLSDFIYSTGAFPKSRYSASLPLRPKNHSRQAKAKATGHIPRLTCAVRKILVIVYFFEPGLR